MLLLLVHIKPYCLCDTLVHHHTIVMPPSAPLAWSITATDCVLYCWLKISSLVHLAATALYLLIKLIY